MNINEIRNKYFPTILANNISVSVSTQEEVYTLFRTKSDDVFGKDTYNKGFKLPAERLKRYNDLVHLYSNIHNEWFIFKNQNGEIIGWFMGEAEDHQTFYMRNTGLILEYQNKGIYTEFCELFCKYLFEVGYERVSSQHHVTNQRILILKMRMGFIITNLEFTESWGPMVKLTKLIPKDRRDFFINMYGSLNHREFFK